MYLQKKFVKNIQLFYITTLESDHIILSQHKITELLRDFNSKLHTFSFIISGQINGTN